MYVNGTNLTKKVWNEYSESRPADTAVRTTYNKSGGITKIQNLWSATSLASLDSNYGHGYNIPHFHRRVRKGELLPHTAWKKFQCNGSSRAQYQAKYSYSDGSCFIDVIHGIASISEGWVLTEAYLESLVPEYLYCAQNAAAKIYSSGFDALTFIAEFKDIPRLFSDVCRKLINLDLPRNWRSMANDWLTARYGIRTLLYDIKNLSEVIQNFNEKCSRSRYSETCGTNSSTSDVSNSTENLGYALRTTTSHDDITISIRGSVTADVYVPPFQFNPIATAWELIPLSFVVDWVLNVGRAISAISFLATNTKYAASAGFRVDVDRYFSVSNTWTDTDHRSGTVYQEATCSASLEVRTPCRIPYTPQFTVRLDSFKIIDLLGLVIQRT